MFNLKAHYALKALVYPAVQDNEQTHTADRLAEETGIPRSYLGKVVQDLSNGDYLNTRKGPRGGVKLSRSPDEIYLVDLFDDLGELYTKPDSDKSCYSIEPFEHCVMEMLVDEFVGRVLADNTIADMRDRLVNSDS